MPSRGSRDPSSLLSRDADDLPLLDLARYTAEQRMAPNIMRLLRWKFHQPLRCAPGDLPAQVLQFITKLPLGHRDRGQLVGSGRITNTCRIEPVATRRRLLTESEEIGGDRRGGGIVFTESPELGVRLVAAGPALEHFLREQGFAPAGDEGGAVQNRGVQAPQSHTRQSYAANPSPSFPSLPPAVRQ